MGTPGSSPLRMGRKWSNSLSPTPKSKGFPFFICEMKERNLGKGCDWASTHTPNIRHLHPSPGAQFTGAGPGWGERRGAETELRVAPGVVRGAGRAQLPSTSMCLGLGNALCRLLSLKSHNQLLSWAAHRRVNRGLGRLSDLLRSPRVAELRFDPSNLWFFVSSSQPSQLRCVTLRKGSWHIWGVSKVPVGRSGWLVAGLWPAPTSAVPRLGWLC